MKIFLAIKAINRLKQDKSQEEASTTQEATKEPSDETKLLSEIRDLLKNRS